MPELPRIRGLPVPGVPGPLMPVGFISAPTSTPVTTPLREHLSCRPSERLSCHLECMSELQPLSLSLCLSSLSSLLLDDLCSCLDFSVLGSLSRSSILPRQVFLTSGELGWDFRTSLDSDFWPFSAFSECLPLCFLEPGSSFSFIILLLGKEEEAGYSACTSRPVFCLSFFFFSSVLSGGKEGHNQ